MQPPFKRVFIANRGEISRRIASTAKALGIETVCVSDQAVPPLYLQGLIDRFAPVEEESPSLYLNAERMVALALEYGCDCLHPGFGFLSENAQFAAAVTHAGLTWLGPSPAAIEAMADKAKARDTAQSMQVPCTRGMRFAADAGRSAEDSLAAFSAQAPFPLLIKAALGGGGKGMRLIHEASQLADAVQKASSEALNSFGDASLVIEQYIAQSRHIEVQILADQHGQTFAIGDRDCSLQRRHQKIIEEAPAPGLSPATREALHAAAIRLAQAVSYTSAGTVEFLLDCSPGVRGMDPQPFYFLEMNTRLQVEHPVTEEVYGLDLVAWQFAIAAGERLPPAYANLKPRGHSIEARLYGEDPQNQFFPAPGPVSAFWPYQGRGVRWEVGLDMVDEVSSRFDPMIAKLVVHGETRGQALNRLAHALGETLVVAPATNKELLIALAQNARFASGAFDTHFIAEEFASLQHAMAEGRSQGAPLAAEQLAWLAAAYESGGLSAESSQKNWGVPEATQTAFQHQNKSSAPTAYAEAGSALGMELRLLSTYDCPQPGSSRRLLYGKGQQPVNGRNCNFSFVVSKQAQKTIFAVLRQGYEYTVIKEKRGWQGTNASAAADGDLGAPVPGKVIKIRVSVGDTVAKDESLFVLESMKMEFDVKATTAGKVMKINVQEGQQVTSGAVLAIIDAPSNT